MHRFASRVAAAFLLALAAPAFAGTLEDIRKRGAIRLGYSETKAPFSFKAKNDGQPAGFSVELCRQVALGVSSRLQLTSLRLEWVPLEPATRLEAVASRKVDIECGTSTVTLARRAKVDFSLPIYLDSATLLGRAAVARNLREMNGRKVAVAEGTTTLAAVERGLLVTGVKADIVRTRTVAEAFERLKAGEVDAIAGDRTTLVGTFLLGGGGEGFAVFPEFLSYEPYALALRRGDADFRLLVDTVLSGIYRSGEIDRIYQAWLAPLGKPSDFLVSLYALSSLPD